MDAHGLPEISNPDEAGVTIRRMSADVQDGMMAKYHSDLSGIMSQKSEAEY